MPKIQFNIFFILSLLAATSEPTVSQERYVYWMHGYGTGDLFWSAFRGEFQALYRIVSDGTTFQTTGGIAATRNAVAQDIALRLPQYGLSANNAIFIGHSMGGLVGRDIERNFGNARFGGIITVGTPHKGAAIAAAARHGGVQGFFNRMVQELSAGPAAQFGVLSSIVVDQISQLYGWFNVITTFVRIPLPTNPSTTDMLPESSFLNGLNAHQTSMPRVAIYGNEDYNSHFRMAGTLGLSGSEEGARSLVYSAAGAYAAVGHHNQGLAIGFSVLGFFSPTWPLALWHFYVADQYFRGEKYLTTNSQIDWNQNVIASFRIEVRKEWVWEPYPIEAYEWRDVWYAIPTRNDGLLSVDTQLYPNTPAGDNYEAVGANHMEQGQHPKVREGLNRIFARSDFFNTKTR